MHDKLKKLHSAIVTVVGEATIEDLMRHPEGKWSGAEILEHLNLTYLGTIKNLERRLAENKPAASHRKVFALQRIVVTRFGLYPARRKSPERAVPRGAPVQQVTAEILRNLAHMDDLISCCETRFSARKPIADHPILGPLTAAEWRSFHRVHGHHHVQQIEALIKKPLL